jgi:phosphate ABC transporter phosphate-binding protein
MKTTYIAIVAIVAIVIIIGGIFAYIYFSQPGTQPTPSTSPTATSPTIPITTNTPSVTPNSAALNGAGATFPLPFINATITKYTTQVRTNVQINYQGVGSGAGISSLTNKAVDFAASDAPLSDSQRAAAPNALHIPETIGAVTLAYNLPGISSGLHLTGTVIANIYMGTVTNWNDAAIAALNPTLTLPTHTITTVHRSDGSGTTNVFTRYLSNVSSTWKSTIGFGTSVQWPGSNSLGASGNSAVASTVNQTTYAIGYVELAYALQNSMSVASIQNPAGNFIAPSLASTATAVQSGASQGLPTGDQSWYNVTLLNTADPQAYPIVSFTYLLVYKELNVVNGMDQNKATQLVQFLWYIVHDGQQLSASLQYAQLPANVVQIDEATIRSITFNGQSLPLT